VTDPAGVRTESAAAACLVIEDDTFVVEIEALGARIRSICHRASGRELLLSTTWSTPPEDDDQYWMRRFANGWNVLIPHAGEPYVVDDVAHPYHGEAARRVWTLSRLDRCIEAEVALTSVPILLTRSVRLESKRLVVEQRVSNLSDKLVRFAWVEHPVLDGALLSGSRAAVFGDVQVPLRDAGTTFDSTSVPEGTCEVPIPQTRSTLRLTWDPAMLPHAHVWQERNGAIGRPWFGEVNGVGIEPASHPSGRPPIGLGPLELAPRAAIQSEVVFTVQSDAASAEPAAGTLRRTDATPQREHSSLSNRLSAVRLAEET
jgi:hypothetical protein